MWFHITGETSHAAKLHDWMDITNLNLLQSYFKSNGRSDFGLRYRSAAVKISIHPVEMQAENVKLVLNSFSLQP